MNRTLKQIDFFRRKYVLVFVLSLGLKSVAAQSEDARIFFQNFDSKAYCAHRQNWSVSHDSQSDFWYFGNSSGLLEYDGSNWRLYKFSKIIRSVFCDSDGRIYTGAHGEFGYWERRNGVGLIYQSLKAKIPDKAFLGESIWNIVPTPDGIFFQSFAFAYLLKRNHQIKKLSLSDNVLFLGQAGSRYFIGGLSKGLFEFRNEKVVKIPQSDFLSQEGIIGVLEIATDKYRIFTRKHVYILDGKKIIIDGQIGEYLANKNINTIVKISSHEFAVGTIQDGVFIYSNTGQLLHHINASSGIQDNTVLRMASDIRGGLWLALENGISYLNFKHPLHRISDRRGLVGITYDACVFQNKLYLGTNRGLFVGRLGDYPENFILMPGTNGQVISLQVIENKVVIGHNNGTYTFDGHRLKKISNITGGGTLVKVPDKALYFQSTYTTPCLYRFDPALGLQYVQSIDGVMGNLQDIKFRDSGSFLAVQERSSLIIGHILKDYRHIKVDNIWSDSSGISLVFDRDKVKVSTLSKGMFELNTQEVILEKIKSGEEYKQLTLPDARFKIFPHHIVSVCDVLGRERYTFSNENLVEEYERVIALGTDRWLICELNGYSILDLSAEKLKSHLSYSPPFVRSIHFFDKGNQRVDFIPKTDKMVELSYRQNSYRLQFADLSILNEAGFYRVLPLHNDWRPIDFKNGVILANLEWGTTCIVETCLSPGHSIERKEFYIQFPWFCGYGARGVYVLFLVGVLYLLKRYFRWRVAVQKSKLELEHQRLLEKQNQEIIELKNKQLESNLIKKSQELANSTINVLKRNKVLFKVKKKIEESSSHSDPEIMGQLTHFIDKNISDKAALKIFDENFTEVHAEFLDKLRVLHPDLSKGEYRLAAYLRMNLSSKEIADLSNITVRSVELKRYRLRKKLNLGVDINLNKYIFNIG